MKKVKYSEYAEKHAPQETTSHQQFAGHVDQGDGATPSSSAGQGPLQAPPGAAGPVGGLGTTVAYAPPKAKRRVKHHFALRNLFLIVIAAVVLVIGYFLATAGVGFLDNRPEKKVDRDWGYQVEIPSNWIKTKLDDVPTASQVNPFPNSTDQVLYTRSLEDGKMVAVVTQVRLDDKSTVDLPALERMGAAFKAQSQDATAVNKIVDSRPAIEMETPTLDGKLRMVVVGDGTRAMVLTVVDRTNQGERGIVDDIVKSFHILDTSDSGG